MRLLKPSWVNHDDNPIFSIDIHPDGTRFATGGQGQDSAGRIVIWNMAPVLQYRAQALNKTNGNNGTAGSAGDAPKILCQLDHHNACVNCVRWSHSGKYLASGGDDKAIMIWKLFSKNRPTLMVANAFGKPTYETWKPISDLRNHRGDILHLSWSPEDKYLASASVDNKVIIWDAQQFPLVVHELNGHTSLVKGVTWDPIGKYLATQSDDKTLKIWRTSDWQLERVISEPFQECAGTTHVLRLDWSPDGQYLVSAHAMNNAGPTAQIIDREDWNTDKDFVGHRKAVVCVRFNPNIMLKGKQFCAVALGSRDRSVSVWSTALQRPLVVVSDLFKNSVMDVSWSSCGKILMACSWDGSAAAVVFKNSEIGEALSLEEKLNVHQKKYGSQTAAMAMKANSVVQNLDVFLAMKNEANKSQAQAPGPPQLQPQAIKKQSPERLALTADSESQQELIARGPTDKQIETRTSDGKRRITPKFLLPSSTSDGFEGSASNESNSNHFGSIDSESKKETNPNSNPVSLRDKMISNISEVKIPNANANSEEGHTSGANETNSQLVNGGALNLTPKAKQEEPQPSTSSAAVANPNCLRVLNSSSHDGGDIPDNDNDKPPVLERIGSIEITTVTVPKPALASTSTSLPKEAEKPKNHPEDLSQRPCSSSQALAAAAAAAAATTTSAPTLIGVKRKLQASVQEEKEMKPPTKLPKKGKAASTLASASSTSTSTTSPAAQQKSTDKGPSSSSSSASLTSGAGVGLLNGFGHSLSATADASASPSKSKGSSVRGGGVRLSPMKSEARLLRMVKTKKDVNYTLEADNAPSSLKGAFLLRCRHDAKSLNGLEWSICTVYPICHITGDSIRIVALSEDSSAHVLDLKGRYVLPPLVLHAFPSKIFHHGPYLLVVTVRATLHLWNIHTKKCVLKAESIAPLLDQCVALDQTTKAPQTLDVAQMNVTQLGSPIVVLTNGKAFHFNTDMQAWMSYVDPGTSIELRPLCTWQHPSGSRLTYSEMRNLKKAEPYVVTQVKLKLATATELQLPDGVRLSLVALGKALAANGSTKELRQLCEDLMGPTHSSAAATSGSTAWNPKIAGVSKREVLREILKTLVQDLEWQDFYAEINDSLTEFEERQKLETQSEATATDS